jgi:coenzyme F420-reducing hydrogenase delta subunit
MCSGRIDPLFIFEAFKYGADGVIICGCRLGECKYMEGNFQALIIGEFAKTLMNEIGINPDRLKLEWVASNESIKLVKDLNEFFNVIKNLGPLGREKNWNEKDKMVYLNSASKICQDRQIRILLGNISTELKSLKDFSLSTVEKKIKEKLLDRLKAKLLEITIKEFVQEGIKDFKTLLQKTQVEKEVLEKIYFQIIKS